MLRMGWGCRGNNREITYFTYFTENGASPALHYASFLQRMQSIIELASLGNRRRRVRKQQHLRIVDRRQVQGCRLIYTRTVFNE